LTERQLLMIPGPTPVPPSVLLSGARPMVNHRGPEMAKLMADCTAGLKRVFQTQHDAFILTCSGTGGLEAAVVNTLSPGEKALSVSIGVFGDRLATIAKTYGAEVESLSYPYGAAADPKQIQERLAADTGKEIKAVLITQNETSTGVCNDLATIGPMVREHGARLIVDGISSLLAMDSQMDNWGMDVVVAGSQKAFMIPPGLCFVAVNDRAKEAMERCTTPRFYLDLRKAKQYLEQGQTPWTPAVPLIWQLGDALKLIEAEGLQNSFARHARLAAMTRAGAKALGLTLFAADESRASNAVTSIRRPEGIATADLRKLMRDKYAVVISGGQGKIKDDIFRIGHLGFVGEKEILAALGCLGLALKEMGQAVDPAAGVAAAMAVVGG
jgi:aspartate aminotransferase-like enzyme